MKIVDLRARTVAIPTNAMLRHNTGVHPGYLMRTVLELVTDEGIVGLGEVGGGDQRGALLKLKPRLLGMNPFDLEAIKLKVLRSIYYLSNSRLYGAIEIACLDIQGKAAGVPMHALLGGKVRDAVPMIAYLFWRYDRPGGGDDTRAEDMADLCVELKETLGVTAMKLKAGVLDPMEEARVVQLCRKRLGDDFGLRIDPNGVWSVATAVRVGRDAGRPRHAVLRGPRLGPGRHAGRAAAGPHSAGHEHVSQQVRRPGPGDPHGRRRHHPHRSALLGRAARREGPGGRVPHVQSGRGDALGAEFGVELAAMLHTACTHSANDHAPATPTTIISKTTSSSAASCRTSTARSPCPTGPGLGVTLDEDKMRHYEKYYEDHGDYYARFHQDPRRPEWYPTVGGL